MKGKGIRNGDRKRSQRHKKATAGRKGGQVSQAAESYGVASNGTNFFCGRVEQSGSRSWFSGVWRENKKKRRRRQRDWESPQQRRVNLATWAKLKRRTVGSGIRGSVYSVLGCNVVCFLFFSFFSFFCMFCMFRTRRVLLLYPKRVGEERGKGGGDD